MIYGSSILYCIGDTSLNKDKLYKKLSEIKTKYIIIDDVELNPTEIIILTRFPYILKKRLQIRNPLFISEGNVVRVVQFCKFCMFYVTPYTKSIVREALHNGIHVINDKVKMIALLLLWSYRRGNENWIFTNLTEFCIPHYIKSDNLLFEKYYHTSSEISKKNHNTKYNRLQFKHIYQLYLHAYRYVNYRIVLKRLGKLAYKHRNSNITTYYKKLVEDKIISNMAEILSGCGSSGGVTIKDSSIFLKGNDLPKYSGILNEIDVRTYLKEQGYYLNRFIHSLSYNKEQVWIKFPYIDNPALEEYVRRNALTITQLKDFGDFLINVLDDLYKLNINHNDLKTNNIIIQVNKYNTDAVSFYLSDFGCASIKGSNPWKNSRFIRRYFISRVCGKYRYSDGIVDDAASAYLTYLECGGQPSDSTAVEIRNRIGRQYLFCQKDKWIFVSKK